MFFLGLGQQAISDADEAFYAEAAREMVEGADWLTPHFNYTDRWQKPVLYYWGAAALYLVTGPTEGAARFWSALSGVGLTLLTWVVARRMRNVDAAWIAGAIVATSYGYVAIARMALPDLPLAFFITLTIWAALEKRWTLAGAAAGLGFLTKGPVAVVIPGIVLVPIWLRERTSGITARDILLGTLAFAAIGLPWYAIMTTVHGADYLRSFFVGDNLERFATDRFNAPRTLWFYLPVVLGGMMPWSIYLLVLPWRRGVDILRARQRLAEEEWRLVIWALVPLVFYTLSVGKQPRYVLPVLPPLAILLAHAIATRVASGRDTVGTAAANRGLSVATWLTAATYVIVAVVLFRARGLFITAYPALTWIGIGALGVAAAALARVAASHDWRRLPVVMTLSACVVLLSIQFGALAGVRPEPVEEMAMLVRTHRTGAEPVGEYQVFVRNLVFYAGFKQVELFPEASALEFVRSSERVLLVVREQDLPRLQALSGVALRTLGSVAYLDPANIKLRTFLVPSPQAHIDTVLLVTNR